MNPIFEFLFGQYSGYATYQIVLEGVVFVFSIISALYSMKNKVLVYPTGIIGSAIFAYLLWEWGLLGDMLINVYYLVMSIYGWYLWTRLENEKPVSTITTMTPKDNVHSIAIFLGAVGFVVAVYFVFDKWNDWTAYVDTFTTGLFFVGMWLLAKHKIENWLFLLAGNIVSVPLYFYKGYTLSSILYIAFIIIAIQGYLAWKKHLNNNPAIA